jgi:hypothetical protein
MNDFVECHMLVSPVSESLCCSLCQLWEAGAAESELREECKIFWHKLSTSSQRIAFVDVAGECTWAT